MPSQRATSHGVPFLVQERGGSIAVKPGATSICGCDCGIEFGVFGRVRASFGFTIMVLVNEGDRSRDSDRGLHMIAFLVACCRRGT